MICRWTNEDIEQILLQLNQRNLPFQKYMFSESEHGLNFLGSGGNAEVYEAVYREKSQEKYAIKVIGFGDGHVDSISFRKIVEIQKELGQFLDYIVKIFDWTELYVWIEGNHNVVRVQEIKGDEEEIPEGDFLHLQFIAMEKLIPVLKSDSVGRIELFLPALASFGKKKNSAALVSFEEREILKLAHDIGMALSKGHKEKLLHRDVKLENIFYSPRKKCYKLGDFGIAKITRNGMALSWNPVMMGIVMLAFCLFWKGREVWLIWWEKRGF